MSDAECSGKITDTLNSAKSDTKGRNRATEQGANKVRFDLATVTTEEPPAHLDISVPHNSLSFLAEVASDPQSFTAAEHHPSWRLTSTLEYLPVTHSPQDISEHLFLQFDERELFQSEVSSLSDSLRSLNVVDLSDEEPEAKRKRTQLPKASFSSFEDTTSSSSSCQSPPIPSTIDDIDEQPLPLKTELNIGVTSFWKYRQIPKGPQGRIFSTQVQLPTDPTRPLKFDDPAFVQSSAASNLSHFGKARIGEGNDTTPNPHKLARIGFAVRDLTKKMKALDNKTQGREKAQLSSNHCRLRKIANNEANKIIFGGMEKEKEELTHTLRKVRETINSHKGDGSVSLSGRVNTVISECYHTQVAGQAGVSIDAILATHGYTSE